MEYQLIQPPEGPCFRFTPLQDTENSKALEVNTKVARCIVYVFNNSTLHSKSPKSDKRGILGTFKLCYGLKVEWQELRSFRYFSGELGISITYLARRFFALGSFFLSHCLAPCSRMLFRDLPRFFARVFPRLPVALRLRFGLYWGLPSPSASNMKSEIFTTCETILHPLRGARKVERNGSRH